jgi:protein TonB
MRRLPEFNDSIAFINEKYYHWHSLIIHIYDYLLQQLPMQSKYASLMSFLLVIGAHIGVLAAVVLSPEATKPAEIVVPTIQGALIMAEPEEVSPPEQVPPPEPPPPPPPQEKKPEPKPVAKPPPKAPASERAVKAPEPEPPAPVEKPADPQPAVPTAPAPVIPPSTDAYQLTNTKPSYPKWARERRLQGTVLLKVLVKANGTVGELKIEKSSGVKALDSAALKAVSSWRFQPATQDGQAIDEWYDLPIEFGMK